jgi:hypothetical protein
MSDEAAAPAPEFTDEPMPLPFGVTSKGKPLNELKPEDWKNSEEAPAAARDRGREKKMLVFAEGVDPMDLASAGWGIVFARDADPAVQEALKPLIEHRRAQVNDAALFKEFSGTKGVRSGESARGWITRQGVDFMEVEPSNGVPLYLLLVGTPEQIPFDFQYALDSYWNVGRLDFDTPAEYATYAKNVIAYEKAAQVPNRKQAVLWNVKNPGDNATGLLHNLVAKPLMDGQGSIKPVGLKAGFKVLPLLADAATKPALLEVLNGSDTPALLFTGSHGVAFPDADEAVRRERQGALLCQEWSRGDDLTEAQYVTGAEILAQAKVPGMIHFLFACYGGGCPAVDNYQRDGNGQPMPLMPKAVVARVPQAMLQKGALAVLAHVDRAWSFGFQSITGKGQFQGFRSVMDRILNGERIGQATDSFNQRWGALSNELLDLTRRREDGDAVPDSVLSNRWVARNDARNYMVLGDPAVRLRVEDMGT